jgi:hypothetical protein
VLIFVNGWNVGQYVNDVGPQYVFVLPQGILRHQGTNAIALAVWSDDAARPGRRGRPRDVGQHRDQPACARPLQPGVSHSRIVIRDTSPSRTVNMKWLGPL